MDFSFTRYPTKTDLQNLKDELIFAEIDLMRANADFDAIYYGAAQKLGKDDRMLSDVLIAKIGHRIYNARNNLNEAIGYVNGITDYLIDGEVEESKGIKTSERGGQNANRNHPPQTQI